MKPRPVAASGIRALLQGKAMVVAGLSNKMAAFSNRLTPRSMQRATTRLIHRDARWMLTAAGIETVVRVAAARRTE
jgi:hypothetical protein